MNNQKLPLFDLFLHLRDTGDFPLTIDQYNLLLAALNKGFGLSSREQLKTLCQMLWVKSKPNSETVKNFIKYFDDYFYQLDTKNQEIVETQKSEPQKSEFPKPEPPKPDLPSFLQTPIALKGGLLPKKPFNQNAKFQLSITDFPITKRKIQRSWRYLRLPIRQGRLTEIDIEATVHKIGEDGFLLEPVIIPQRINRAEVLLLIDASNSMIPFFLLSQQLVDNLQGSKLGKSEVYYFRNCPGEYLFFHPQRPGGKLTSDVLYQFSLSLHIIANLKIKIYQDLGVFVLCASSKP
ncbi:hypothetical protein H6G06_05095 [Anabaena sphaerica FACHB-251]|uniref:VWA containing CoxE family protein n=1 Tax=Anabaena sphaerica FACHB-251 TaxID=2692883 RepID=A0A926WGU4_9NOST|nr:hypothetical protein [Anabaena sphaerica]MBD2292873.1 hypothetical protein [Anabaena sphaerica FACHB-251]